MRINLRMAFCAATMAAGLAATPAPAQMGSAASGGAVSGGAFGGGAVSGGAVSGGAFGGGAVGGFAGGGHAGVPNAMPAPQYHPAPVVVPQAHVPQVAPGGGYGVPRAGNPVGAPIARGAPWTGGGVTHAPRQPRAWPGAGGGVAHPNDTAQSMYHGGGRHHGRGRGHWRGGVWYPYALGGYDAYPSYDYDDDYCTLRKVRVHTRYGWRRVWRRVCT